MQTRNVNFVSVVVYLTPIILNWLIFYQSSSDQSFTFHFYAIILPIFADSAQEHWVLSQEHLLGSFKDICWFLPMLGTFSLIFPFPLPYIHWPDHTNSAASVENQDITHSTNSHLKSMLHHIHFTSLSFWLLAYWPINTLTTKKKVYLFVTNRVLCLFHFCHWSNSVLCCAAGCRNLTGICTFSNFYSDLTLHAAAEPWKS